MSWVKGFLWAWLKILKSQQDLSPLLWEARIWPEWPGAREGYSRSVRVIESILARAIARAHKRARTEPSPEGPRQAGSQGSLSPEFRAQKERWWGIWVGGTGRLTRIGWEISASSWPAGSLSVVWVGRSLGGVDQPHAGHHPLP